MKCHVKFFNYIQLWLQLYSNYFTNYGKIKKLSLLLLLLYIVCSHTFANEYIITFDAFRIRTYFPLDLK